MALQQCPICNQYFDQDVLAIHAESHFQAEEQHVLKPESPSAIVDLVSSQASDSYDDGCAAGIEDQDEEDLVLCPFGCDQMIPIQDLDSHELAHTLAQQDASQGARDFAVQQEEEDFKKLQAKYGFSENVERPGKCHTCGQAGHWARDCPRNPNSFVNKVKPVLPIDVATLTASQRREQFYVIRGGVIPLLAGCLESQPGSMGSTSYLCGVVHPICGSLADSGWGCGYRNMQMISSHLLQRHPELRAALFRGSGFVPDIGSLQAWIEAAWKDGFDRLGAEQLGQKLQGSRKWVGTTEAATLFAYFSLKPRIVDFMGGTRASQSQSIMRETGSQQGQTGPESRPDPLAASHTQNDNASFQPGTSASHIIQSDMCDDIVDGTFPDGGPLKRGRHMDDSKGNNPNNGKNTIHDYYRPSRGGGRTAASSRFQGTKPKVTLDSSQHAALIKWVWEYFSNEVATAAELSVDSTAMPGSTNERRGVTVTSRTPLYFQHEGHSRTIIGIERLSRHNQPDHYNLLVLDPGTRIHILEQALRARSQWQKFVKRGLHTLTKPQYQVMFIEDGLATPEVREQLKVVQAWCKYQ